MHIPIPILGNLENIQDSNIKNNNKMKKIGWVSIENANAPQSLVPMENTAWERCKYFNLVIR